MSVDKVWAKVGEPVLNNLKLYVLKEYLNDVLTFINPKVMKMVSYYSNTLPKHVKESEIDDLVTVAQLEFIETLKIWKPDQNENIWPLARTRIIGAMKDHIRHITRTDPSRFYDWVSDAAFMYTTVNSRADFSQKIETGEQLNQAMRVLTQRERQIVIAHTKSDLTFKQIGLQLKISESQISRIYKKCLEKLKKELSD